MTLAVVTLSTPNLADLAAYTGATKLAYCRRHGYRYAADGDRLDHARPASWSKILMVRRELREAAWVLWTDADAMIANPAVKLESLIDDAADFIVAGDAANGLNAGVFLIRSCPASLAFLALVYQQAQYTFHHWWEQAAMIHLIQTGQQQVRVKYVPQRTFNSYTHGDRVYRYRPGDFILHAPGGGDKLEKLKADYEGNQC